jgi:hypothetical protein
VSGVHVYCIAPATHTPAAELQGLAGEPVRAQESGSLTVWYSAHAERPAPSLEHVRVHDAVVRAAMTQEITPVPVRFGQWFEDAADAAAQVAAQADHWLERLRHFAARAEYGVRILPPHEGPDPARDVHTAPAADGRAYMEALVERRAEAARERSAAEAVAAAVSAQVSDLVADSRTEARPDGQTYINMAHLVAWRDAEAYHSQMRLVRDARTDLRFSLSGPWPPYSFVA